MDIDKFKKLLKNISTQYTQDLDIINKKGEDISIKTLKLQMLISNRIKEKCLEPYDWLEKHGHISENDFDLVIRIHPKHKTEKVIYDLHNCVIKNDLGVKDYYSKIKSNQSDLQTHHIKCMENCRITEDVNECVKKCTNISLEKLNNMYEEINKKLDETLNVFK